MRHVARVRPDNAAVSSFSCLLPTAALAALLAHFVLELSRLSPQPTLNPVGSPLVPKPKLFLQHSPSTFRPAHKRKVMADEPVASAVKTCDSDRGKVAVPAPTWAGRHRAEVRVRAWPFWAVDCWRLDTAAVITTCILRLLLTAHGVYYWRRAHGDTTPIKYNDETTISGWLQTTPERPCGARAWAGAYGDRVRARRLYGPSPGGVNTLSSASDARGETKICSGAW